LKLLVKEAKVGEITQKGAKNEEKGWRNHATMDMYHATMEGG
jgi:hypothetical protein